MNEDLAKLVETGKITSEMAAALSPLVAGCYCFHSTFGPGRVTECDTLSARLLIDFENKPAHEMGLRIAVKTLKPLSEEHVLAQLLRDPEATRNLAQDDPVAFVGMVLHGAGGSMSLDEFDQVVKGRVVDEAGFKKWWEGAKRLLRGHREFVVPAKRNEPLQLRESNLSPAEQFIEDFDLARDLKQKAKLLQEIRKHAALFEGAPSQLEPVIVNAGQVAMKSQKLHPAAAIDLMLARDQLIEGVPGLALPAGEPAFADLLRVESGRLAEAMKSIGPAAARAVTEALPGVFGEEWVRRAQEIMAAGCGPRAFIELASKLAADPVGSEPLGAFIRKGISQRSLEPDALTWLCRERRGSSAAFFGHEVGMAVLEAVERVFTRTESTRGNRLLDLLQDDATLVSDMLADAPQAALRSFARRLISSSAIDDLSRRSLLARAIKARSEVQDLVDRQQTDQETPEEVLIVSWESLARKKAELEDIVQRQIPDNSKDIALARSYGDLRENFEFKSAKQTQDVLMRRKEQIEREIGMAKGGDLTDADGSEVAVGTVVTLRGPGGESRVITLLGAWDGDPERDILSYLSASGQALLGHRPGDNVDLPNGDGGSTSTWTIEAIRPWSPSPSP